MFWMKVELILAYIFMVTGMFYFVIGIWFIAYKEWFEPETR